MIKRDLSGPICHCPHCDAVFVSRFFAITNSTNVTIENCQEPCERCGCPASVLDGTFDFAGDAISIVKAPGFTVEMLSRFAALSQAAISEKISPSEFKAESARLGKPYEALADQANSKGRSGLVVLGVILVLLQQCSLNVELDINDLYDQVERSLSGGRRSE